MFDPGKPDGNNQSLKIGISNDGTPKLNFTYKIPARCGIAVKLKINQIIEIENRSGTQVCDFWALMQKIYMSIYQWSIYTHHLEVFFQKMVIV